MTCVACEKSIVKHFAKINIKTEISVVEGSGTFYYNEAEWSVEDIMNNIRGVGYKPYIEFKYKKTKQDYIEIIEVSISLAITTLFITNMFKMAGWIPWAPKFMENGWIQFILATYVQIYVGRRFYKSALAQIRGKQYGMDVLVAFSTTIAYTYSVYLLFKYGSFLPAGKMFFFETAVEVISFLLLGKIIEEKVRRKATAQLRKILNQQHRQITLLNGDIKDSSALVVGDKLILKSGQRIPTDAKIIEGSTTVDESSITGESLPIFKKVNDELVAGSINSGGTITIRVTIDAKKSSIQLISNSIKELQKNKAPIAKLVDRISNVFVPSVIVFIVITFIGWIIISKGEFNKALYYSIAVAVVACPCALGLATPMSIVSGATRAIREGILYNKADVFERLKKIDVIAFDKTGTITKGELFIEKVIGASRELDAFASLEIISMHPIAKAFMNYKDQKKDFDQKSFTNYEEIIGSGVKGECGGAKYIIGAYNFVTKKAVINSNLKEQYLNSLQEGNVIVVGAINGVVVSLFVLSDQIKETTKEAIDKLHQKGIKTVIITGDNEVTARHISNQLGIDEVHARIQPMGKKVIIEKLQQEGYKVAFVGDGVNDAAALAQADLSIAMGSGSDIAQSTADITLLNSDLLSIHKALYISDKTLKNIYQNISWAFVWNGTMIPLAAIGLLSPWVAAMVMSIESLVVVLNATRLNLIKIK